MPKEGYIHLQKKFKIPLSPIVWRKLYCSLDDWKLALYTSHYDSYTTQKIIPLSDIHSGKSSKHTCNQLVIKCDEAEIKKKNVLQIVTSTKEYFIECESPTDLDDWVNAIKFRLDKGKNITVTHQQALSHARSLFLLQMLFD